MTDNDAKVAKKANSALRIALRKAATNGDLPTVEKILSQGVPPSCSALEGASKAGHLEVVKALIAAGADVADSNSLKNAATMGHLEVVKVLLEAGADIMKRYIDLSTGLYARRPDEQVLEGTLIVDIIVQDLEELKYRQVIHCLLKAEGSELDEFNEDTFDWNFQVAWLARKAGKAGQSPI